MNIGRFFSFAAVLLVLLVAPVSAGQIIFADGFESGDTSAWTDDVSATLLGTSAEVNHEGNPAQAEFRADSRIRNRKVGLNPGDLDIFIPPFVNVCRGNISPECGFSLVIETVDGNIHTCGIVGIQVVTNDPAPPNGDTNFNWRVRDRGGDREFWVYAVFNNEGCTTNSFRMRQTGFSYDYTPDAVGTTLFPLNSGGFITPSVLVQGSSNLSPEESAKVFIEALPHPVGAPGVYTFVETGHRPGILELVE